MSFGLKSPKSVTVNACVPEINWLLTKLSCASKTSANTFSIVSLPMSEYPYPVVLLKWISEMIKGR